VSGVRPFCREELNQPLFAAIDAFEYPELHDESIAARNFFRHLAKLMSACGVKDFGIKVRSTCFVVLHHQQWHQRAAASSSNSSRLPSLRWNCSMVQQH
jgi:hypothetical protein